MQRRTDGWPLCPHCGQDELWSPLVWDGIGERPTLGAYAAAGLRCYYCHWTDADGALAAAVWAAEMKREREPVE